MDREHFGGRHDQHDRPWTDADVPDQRGRIFIVTGANSGLGFEASRVLAGRRARVVLACRDLAKAQAARRRITTRTPDAQCEVAFRAADPRPLRRARAVRSYGT